MHSDTNQGRLLRASQDVQQAEDSGYGCRVQSFGAWLHHSYSIHDEVALRARTKAVLPDGGQHCQTDVCSRANSSKVMNQVLYLALGDERREYFVELAGLLRKDGPTITHSLQEPLKFLLGVLNNTFEGQARRVFHLVTGDAIITNENALKRLWRKNCNAPAVMYFCWDGLAQGIKAICVSLWQSKGQMISSWQYARGGSNTFCRTILRS